MVAVVPFEMLLCVIKTKLLMQKTAQGCCTFVSEGNSPLGRIKQ